MARWFSSRSTSRVSRLKLWPVSAIRFERFHSSSRPSSAISRAPASNDAACWAMPSSTPPWEKANLWCSAIGPTPTQSCDGSKGCRPRRIPETSMRVWREIKATLPIVAMTVAGFALTLYVFYPGVMTFDSRYIYQYVTTGFYGDWQSPVMTLVWSLIDPIAPGPGSLLLLTATLYWLAFGMVALTVARRSPWIALLLPLLALSPPAFVFVGIICRDVLFASAWLLAAGLG